MFASKRAVSVPVDSPAVTSPEIPSEEAMKKIRALADQISALKTELADAENGVAVAIQNRGIVQLVSGNPDEIIAKAKAAVDSTRRKLSGAKNEFTRTFIASASEFNKTRAEVWAEIYNGTVRPRAAKVTSALDVLERAIDEVAEVFGAESETVRRLESLDAGSSAWNTFVTELGGLGNAALPSGSGLSGLRSSFAQTVNVRRLESTLRKIQEVLNPAPAPAPFKTEEQLAEERRRAAENALAATNQREVDQQISSMREKELLSASTARKG